MINRYRAVVESCRMDESIAWLKLNKGRVASRLWPALRKGQSLDIRIAPADVLLFAEHPGRTSARNALPGHVKAIRYVPEGAYVTTDVGFPLTALISRKSVAELELRKGSPVFAVFKIMAVQPELSIRARFRVCLEGAGGVILPRQMEFLRVLRDAGSLSAAARELGATYRTAWMWIQAINRVWGKPLVTRQRGGQGGGGVALTPEGLAALAAAAELESASRATSSHRQK